MTPVRDVFGVAYAIDDLKRLAELRLRRSSAGTAAEV
jgi:hypothetical protein